MPTGLPASSVDVAAITPLPTQLLDLRRTQYLAQHRIHARRQASEAAAPASTQHRSSPAVSRNRMLYVDALGLVARPGEIGALDPAIGQPALDLVAIEEVVRRMPLAEQQPIAPMAGASPLQLRGQRRRQALLETLPGAHDHQHDQSMHAAGAAASSRRRNAVVEAIRRIVAADP